MHGHSVRSICIQLSRPCSTSAQMLDGDERDRVLAAAIEHANARTTSLRLAQICAKSPSKAPFVTPGENIVSRIRIATFLLLDNGVTSAATARQAFAFRDPLGERIITR